MGTGANGTVKTRPSRSPPPSLSWPVAHVSHVSRKADSAMNGNMVNGSTSPMSEARVPTSCSAGREEDDRRTCPCKRHGWHHGYLDL